MNLQELLLLIKGDGSSAVKAVQDVANASGDLDKAVAKSGDNVDAVGSKFKAFFSQMADGGHKAFSALGGDAKDLGETLKSGIESPMSTLKGVVTGTLETLGEFGVGLTIASGVAAAAGVVLFELAEGAAKVGGALNDMSEKSGIAVEPLSNLRGAAIIAGSSIDQVTNAVFMMQRRFSEGGPAVEKGLEKIGLSLDEIRYSKPEEAFTRVAESIRGITDPATRASAAMDIFGRQGRELLPLMMKDLQGLTEQSKELGSTWSTEDAEAAEKFEQQVNALGLAWSNMKTLVGRELIPLISGPMEFAVHSLGWLLTDTETSPFAAWIEDAHQLLSILNSAAELTGLKDITTPKPSGTGYLADEAAKNSKAVKDYEGNLAQLRAGTDAAVVKQEMLAGALDHVRQQVDALNPDQARQAAELLKGGESAAKVADLLGVSAVAVSNFEKAQKQGEAQAKKFQEAMQALSAAGVGLGGTLDTIDGKVVEGVKYYLAAGVEQGKLATVYGLTGAQIKAIAADFDEAKKKQEAYTAAWEQLNSTADSFAATADAIDPKLRQEVEYYLQAGNSVKAVADAFPELTEAQVKAVDETLKQAKKFTDAWQKAQDDIDKIWTDALDIQQETGKKGLDLQVSRLQKQEDNEKASWQKRYDAGTIGEEQLEEALAAIDAKYDAERADKRVKAEQDLQKQLAGIWNDYYDLVDKETLNSTDYQIAQEKRKYQEAVKAAQDAGVTDQRYYDALKALADKRVEDIVKQNDRVFQAQKQLQEAFSTGWADEFQKTLNDTHSFTQAFVAAFDYLKNAVMNAASAMLTSMVQGFLQPFLSQLYGASGGLGSRGMPVGGQQAGGGMYGQLGAAAANWLSGGGRTGSGASGAAAGTGTVGPEGVVETTGLPQGTTVTDSTTVGSKGGLFSQPTSTAGKAGMAAGALGAGIIANATANYSTKAGQVTHYAATGAEYGAIAGPIGMAVGAGIGAIVGALKVSPEELNARKAFTDWQTQVISNFDQTATESQKAEAGTDDWKKMVVSVRDAYTLVGKSGDQALKDLDTATDATHKNQAAVQAALDTINQTMQQAAQVAQNSADGIQQFTNALAVPASSRATLDQVNQQIADITKQRDALASKGILSDSDAQQLKDLNTQLDTLKKQQGVASGILDATGFQPQDYVPKLTAIIKGMATDEAKAFSDAYREAQKEGFQGTQEDFLQQQAQLYETAGEGDARIKTFLYGNTLDAFKKAQSDFEAESARGQQAAEAYGASIAGLFNKELQSGMSFTDALKAVEPAVANFEKAIEGAGATGGAAFETIKKMVDLANDEIAGPALNAVQALGQGMKDLDATGLDNQQTFSALAGQIGHTYNSLVSQGKDGGAVMQAMQAQIQEIWEDEQKFGYTVDDSTQALVDEAVKAGMVGEAHKSSTDQMVDGINKVDTDLQQLAYVLSNGMVGSLAAVGTKATDVFKSINNDVNKVPRTIPIDVKYTASGDVPGAETVSDTSSEGGGSDVPSFDQRPMERVVKAGLAMLHPGDLVGVPPAAGTSKDTGSIVGGDDAGKLDAVASGVADVTDKVRTFTGTISDSGVTSVEDMSKQLDTASVSLSDLVGNSMKLSDALQDVARQTGGTEAAVKASQAALDALKQYQAALSGDQTTGALKDVKQSTDDATASVADYSASLSSASTLWDTSKITQKDIDDMKQQAQDQRDAYKNDWSWNLPKDGSAWLQLETSKIPSYDQKPWEAVTKSGLALLHPGDVVGVPPTAKGRSQQSSQQQDKSSQVSMHFSVQAVDARSFEDLVSNHPKLLGRLAMLGVEMGGDAHKKFRKLVDQQVS